MKNKADPLKNIDAKLPLVKTPNNSNLMNEEAQIEVIVFKLLPQFMPKRIGPIMQKKLQRCKKVIFNTKLS